jgi:membrane-bound lytic murein transglycosylase D
MLNRKLNLTGSLLLILFFSVLRSNAGSNPSFLNYPSINDTSNAVLSFNSSVLTPEIPLHPSMGNFVDDYADDNNEVFEKIKLTKSNYFKTIDNIFVQHNIPVELKYLAVIESRLNTNARSGVGAVGVWQFMPGTAKIFGLKITSKYDERRNFWKSSVAAARYLNDLYDIFGDWLLVIASYNSGPAPVLNAIKKSGSKSFWKLQYFLPKETRLHVKRFIATHYYFEGHGSLVTLGKTESEKYLKELEQFNAKNNSANEPDNTTNSVLVISQWTAIINTDKNLNLVLKK